MIPRGADEAIRRALAEDLSAAGDVTTDATVEPGLAGEGAIVAREEGVIAGLDVAGSVFGTVDPRLEWAARTEDGDRVRAGTVVAHIRGAIGSILTGERTALNFLGELSGVATATADLVRRVEGTGARIVDTRKTTPGLRALQKHAVRMGGGHNHRFGLFDAVLIKDNHLVAAGGVEAAVQRARARVGHMIKIEVEVETLDQLDLALEAGVDAVLLDNMEPDTMREAVARAGPRVVTEASGNITAATVRRVAETGVACISAGWITHSAPALDVALDLGDISS